MIPQLDPLSFQLQYFRFALSVPVPGDFFKEAAAFEVEPPTEDEIASRARATIETNPPFALHSTLNQLREMAEGRSEDRFGKYYPGWRREDFVRLAEIIEQEIGL